MMPFQYELWRWAREHADQYALNVLRAFRLRGALDTIALDRALGDLVARHEALRTVFVADDDGRPRAAPIAPVVRVATTDLRAIADPVAEVPGLLERARLAPFEGGAPPFRFHLLCLGDEDHVLGLVFDHLAVDAHSIQTIHHDLARGYNAARGGTRLTLETPPSPTAFVDAFAGSRRAASSPHDGWLSVIARSTPLRPWDAERDERTPWATAGDMRIAFVPEPLTRAVRRIGEGGRGPRRPSLFSNVLTAFLGVLLRRTAQREFVLASIFNNRVHPRFDDTVGCFASQHLPIHLALEPEASFTAVSTALREEFVRAIGAQHVPLPDAMRGHRYSVFANHMQKPRFTAEALAMDGLTKERFPVPPTRVTNHLQLATEELADGAMVNVIVYDRTLFDPQAIEAMMTELLDAMRFFAEKPSASIV